MDFKRYLTEAAIAAEQPVTGDAFDISVNEMLNVECSVVDHGPGSVTIMLDERAISMLEHCGCQFTGESSADEPESVDIDQDDKRYDDAEDAEDAEDDEDNEKIEESSHVVKHATHGAVYAKDGKAKLFMTRREAEEVADAMASKHGGSGISVTQAPYTGYFVKMPETKIEEADYSETDSHGPYARGAADADYGRKYEPHKFVDNGKGGKIKEVLTDLGEIAQYKKGYTTGGVDKQDFSEQIAEAIKLNSKVRIHDPGKKHHGEEGTVVEFRRGLPGVRPSYYTVDHGGTSTQFTRENIKTIKEEEEAVTVNKKNYSWGKMITVHHGASHSFPLHPEHQEAIAKLKNGESTSFTDETKSKVTAHRDGDMVHLSLRGSNTKTPVAMSHFNESDQIDENFGGQFKNPSEWENAAKKRGLVVRLSTHPSGEEIPYQTAKDKSGNHRGYFDHGTKSGRLTEESKQIDEISKKQVYEEHMSEKDAESLAQKHVDAAISAKKSGNLAGYYAHAEASNYILDKILAHTYSAKGVPSGKIRSTAKKLFGESSEHSINEAEYQGREVKLGKPTTGDVKKFKVYVKDPKTGNVKKVNFGDPNMEIKRDNPERRKNFRARHNCADKTDRTKAGYWACRFWSNKPVSKII